MLFFEISIFASDVFVSKNRPKGHGICLFLVMESHEKSWNLNFQKEYEPCFNINFSSELCKRVRHPSPHLTLLGGFGRHRIWMSGRVWTP